MWGCAGGGWRPPPPPGRRPFAPLRGWLARPRVEVAFSLFSSSRLCLFFISSQGGDPVQDPAHAAVWLWGCGVLGLWGFGQPPPAPPPCGVGCPTPAFSSVRCPSPPQLKAGGRGWPPTTPWAGSRGTRWGPPPPWDPPISPPRLPILIRAPQPTQDRWRSSRHTLAGPELTPINVLRSPARGLRSRGATVARWIPVTNRRSQRL